MTPLRRILILVVVAAAAAATWGVMGREGAGPVMAVMKKGAESAPVASATAAPRADDQPSPASTVTVASQAAADPVVTPMPGTIPSAHTAVAPSSPTINPTPVATSSKANPADWAVQAVQAMAPAAKKDQPNVDPAAQMIAAVAASQNPGSSAQSFGGGTASGGTNNLAPLPGGAGLVINDGRIPVGFVIDPKEYTGGILRITNASGTPAILTINDPTAAAACSIAGEAVVVGKPYQVDGLEITAAHPVAVFVQPGRAPGPPAGPRPPRSDG